MPTLSAFEYAVVRVVPRVHREEFLNVGVILFCAEQAFLQAQIELDTVRLRHFAPSADVELIGRHLAAIPRICAGGESAGAIGCLPIRERWQWLAAPRSTIVQTSAPHAGLCSAPAEALARLVRHMIEVE